MKCRFHANDDAVWMVALGRLSDMHTEVMPVCDWCADALTRTPVYRFQGKLHQFDEADKRKITALLRKCYTIVTLEGE